MEFSPDGVFDDRRSIIAGGDQVPVDFANVAHDGEWAVLDTGSIQLRARHPHRPFDRTNLEARWVAEGLTQYWRPGDRDHLNLGGTLRSLDRFGRNAKIEGVHIADGSHPDAKGLPWLAWLQCEDDVPFYEMSPAAPQDANRGGWDNFARQRDSGGRLLHRTLNWAIDAHRYSVGLLSRAGYFLLNDSGSAVLDEDGFPIERDLPGYQDWYLFAYGRDYHAALREFIRVCGPAPLPTRRTLGVLFSRWPAYDPAEAARIVARFRNEGYPLSTLIFDMEWHKEGWGHWEWDTQRYPDPERFIEWCHQQGMEVVLNDHPLDLRSDDVHFEPYLAETGTGARVKDRTYNGRTLPMVDINICDKREALAFSRLCHRPILDQGVDYWWNDGSRGELSHTMGQLVANHLFFNEVAGSERRGMLLARYGGLGSHRYGAFFTGDTESCWPMLAIQCEFTIRAGHVGQAYVSHDIGGFYTKTPTDLIELALFVRWVQLGVFSPVLRFHSAPEAGSRQPWDYEQALGGCVRRWMRQRNSLLPYLYSAARQHHETGIPIVRGLYLDDPQDPACERFDQYGFGPALVVAPMLDDSTSRELYLPRGRWFDYFTGQHVDGGQMIKRTVGLDDVPVYARAGGIVLRQPEDSVELHAAHQAELLLDVFPGADGEAILYEDDGVAPRHEAGAYCKTRFTVRETPRTLLVCGSVIEGKPFGPSRSIIIRMPWTGTAPQVSLRRPREESLTVHMERSWATVSVAAVPAEQPLEIAFHRPQSLNV
jgi:hypothetical protein